MEQLKASEIRIGNLVEYYIEDSLDQRKGWWEINIIDAEDILWLSKNDDTDYRPITLTEEWLKKFDYKPHPMFNLSYQDIGSSTNCPQWVFVFIGFDGVGTKIYYVHQLQNLYFALTGEELTIKQQENGK